MKKTTATPAAELKSRINAMRAAARAATTETERQAWVSAMFALIERG